MKSMNIKPISKQNNKKQRVLICNSCADDCYVDNLKECLQFIQTKKSNRLLELYRNQSAQVYKIELKKIQQASKLYHIRICSQGTPHLWKEQSKVLMVRQAYQFARQLHGSQHLSVQQMTQKASQYKVYLIPLLDFIQEYPSFCKFCLSIHSNTKPLGTEISPIWSILLNRFNLNFHQYDRDQTVDELLKRLDIAQCLNDSCTRDQYDRQNQICLFIITKKCFPPLPKGEGSSPNRSRLKKKAKLMRIRQCQFKTDHLWMKQSQLKVPMQNQARQIAKLLHGQRAHRPKRHIKQIIFKNQTKIYAHGLIPAIDQIVSLCTFCNPKTADPVQDRQSNSEQEKAQQNAKVQKRPKIPYARMGLQRKSYWLDQLLSKPELKQKVQRIKQVIDNLQLWEDPQDYIPRIVQMTGFYQVAVQLVIDNIHWSRASQQKLTQTLSQVKGLIFRSVKQARILKVMFVCTQTMRCNYYRYGETLSIDYISGVTRKREASGRNYLVGFFTGQDHTGNLVIFGVSLISKQLSAYHLKSLQLFYDVMGKQKLPSIICIPDSKPLIMSLQIFKRQKNLQFEYAINWFYVVQFLKKNSSQELQKSTIIQLFCKAMSEPIPAVYRYIMMKIRSQIVNTGIFRQIQKLGEMFCVSRLKQNFIGYGLSTERVEKLYGILEKDLVYQLKIGSFFNNLFRLDKKICEERSIQQSARLSNNLTIIGIQNKVIQIHRKYLQQLKQAQQNNHQLLQGSMKPQKLAQKLQQVPMHDLEQLLSLSSFLHINIFDLYLDNYYLSLPHLITLSTTCKYQSEYTIKQNKTKNKCVYFCKYFIQDNCWKCNCGFFAITGLPCPHLIRIVLQVKGSLQYYISSRWLFPPKQDINYSYIPSKLQTKIQDRISDHLSVRSHHSGSHKQSFTVKQNESDDNASYVSGSVASHKLANSSANQNSVNKKSQNQISKQSQKKGQNSQAMSANISGNTNSDRNNQKSMTFRQLFFEQLQNVKRNQQKQKQNNQQHKSAQKASEKSHTDKVFSQKSKQPINIDPQSSINNKYLNQISDEDEYQYQNQDDQPSYYISQMKSEGQRMSNRDASALQWDQYDQSSLKISYHQGNLYQWNLDKKHPRHKHKERKEQPYPTLQKKNKKVQIKREDIQIGNKNQQIQVQNIIQQQKIKHQDKKQQDEQQNSEIIPQVFEQSIKQPQLQQKIQIQQQEQQIQMSRDHDHNAQEQKQKYQLIDYKFQSQDEDNPQVFRDSA